MLDVRCSGKLEEENIFTADIFKEKDLDDKESDYDKDRFYKRFIDDMVAAFLGLKKKPETLLHG